MNKPKILTSKTKIRFQDCDPFNHLNNGRYIDYFINQREDQVMDAYGIDIFTMILKEKIGWVISNTQLAYLIPAYTMEEVCFESQTIAYSKKHLQAEVRMFNKDKTVLKSIAWISFVHFDLQKNKTTEHSEKFMKLFEETVLPLSEKTFDERERNLRTIKKNS